MSRVTIVIENVFCVEVHGRGLGVGLGGRVEDQNSFIDFFYCAIDILFCCVDANGEARACVDAKSFMERLCAMMPCSEAHATSSDNVCEVVRMNAFYCKTDNTFCWFPKKA